MTSERLRTIAHRLYLTGFWPALLVAVGFPAFQLIAYVHDRGVTRTDFGCFKRELAREQADPSLPPSFVLEFSPKAAQACHIEPWPDETRFRYGYSRRAWRHDLALEDIDTRGVVYGAAISSVLAALPVVVLVGIRRWLAWLLSPSKPDAGGGTTA